ncbi:MAG TPA: dihydroorotate dehydrogenase electron transfer subunit [Halanaerobiales bacterium]|nr:dihydroorotate dehydrogenase electron transfer subunit [Halanaerobiales bacterium]
MLVKSNEKVGPGIYKMVFKTEKNPTGKPGQFIHLKINNASYDPLLRRPFSIFDINKKEKSLTIIYKICGRGTRLMKDIKKGDEVDILENLGNGFNLNNKNKKIVLIGGGMGIAPLYLLTKKLYKKNKLMVLLGAKNKEELDFMNNKFSKLDVKVYKATIDNSLGFKGTVVDLLKELIKGKQEIDYMYGCGPTAMLRELKEIAINKNIKAEVSLEERMGCGVGVCLSCTVKTVNGNMRACKEGPVFPLKEVIFSE